MTKVNQTNDGIENQYVIIFW